MEVITINLDVALDLVDTKLRVIKKEIEKILKVWGYTIPKKFIDDARKGIIGEAEDDAITLRHLLDQREELFDLRKTWVR